MVLPSSHRVSRVRRYSGSCPAVRDFVYATLTSFGVPSHALRLSLPVSYTVRTPRALLLRVWPLPRSLATTCGISVDFFSSPYLDVSVQAVPLIRLCIHRMMHGHDSVRVSPFRYPRIKVCLLLPAAFRSLPRLSSAPGAKAFALRPF